MEAKALTKFRYEMPEEYNDDFKIEYEILPAFDKKYLDPRRAEIAEKIADIDAQRAEFDAKSDELNTEIERFTNHADGFDYSVAVGAGVLCGLIDSLFVGEFEMAKIRRFSVWRTFSVQ